MAKHVAYPCLVASFFFNFGGIDAKSGESSPLKLEKSMSTFRQDTINYNEYQDVSFGSESSYDSQDDAWLSSGSLLDTGSLSDSSSETRSCRTSSDDSDQESQPNQSEDTAQDPRSKLYVDHLQLWVGYIDTDHPQTAEEHRAVFQKSFPDGIKAENVYRTVKSGKNTHYFAPGITPVKLKTNNKIQSTPRRQDNISRLREGESPIWVDPRPDKSGKPKSGKPKSGKPESDTFHMHHLGQLNSGTFIIMVPVDIHYSKGFHTYHGSSRIDRSEFKKEKRGAHQGLAEEIERSEFEKEKRDTRQDLAKKIKRFFPQSPSFDLAEIDKENSGQDVPVSTRTRAKKTGYLQHTGTQKRQRIQASARGNKGDGLKIVQLGKGK